MGEDNHDRTWDLDYRLQQHFDWLNATIEERDRLALDAAWGLVEPAAKQASFQSACAILIIAHVLDVGTAWAVAAAVACYFVLNFRSGRKIRVQWAQEKDRLARLPEWKALQSG